MKELKIEHDIDQLVLFGSIMQTFTCTPKPASQQCHYMLVIEWLERMNLALRNFFEQEAEYDDQHRLDLPSLKKYGQLVQGIHKMQTWIKEEALSCGVCLECHSVASRHDIIEADPYEILDYYEKYYKTIGRSAGRGGSKTAANGGVPADPHWWHEGAD